MGAGAINGIIWDLDGTLYRYNAARRDVFCRAAARAARLCGVPEDEDLIFTRTMEAPHSHAFVDVWQRDYGMDRVKFHHLYHDIKDMGLVSVRVEGLAGALRCVAVAQIILTHASRQWARRMLAHLGLADIFPDDRVIVFEDVDFIGKHQSAAPFERALARLDRAASQVAVVEDSAANLQHAHALGMRTVLVHYGRPLEPVPDYVQEQYGTACDFIKSYTGRPE